ncbi:MAG: threonine ammonia-lyase [Desulfobulbaceae bacterium]|nr:threonine ammonia-lyase [Desulfobulbaceae bacterium]
MTVSLDDIQKAAKLLQGSIEKTPCVNSRVLSQITGAELFLKFENLQFTGSFKDRGALVKLLSLSESERKHGIIAMSAGNHAQAVAYHAQRLRIPATVVMPLFTPNIKVEHTRNFGAEVILHGNDLAEAADYALEISRQQNLSLIHPYDDPKIIAGQGTIALEMLADFADLDALVVPIGGGGLISGVSVAAKSLNPHMKIIGVETNRYPSMKKALAGQRPDCGTFSIAEGIAVKDPGKLTLPIVRKWVDDIVLVDEPEIEEAVLLFLEVEKTVAEGAGAVGLAALLQNKKRFSGQKVGLILSGGNIDMPILSSIIQRGLVRSRRMVKIDVDLRDVPGALARLTGKIGIMGANIIQISHQRTLTHLPIQVAEVELLLQTKGSEHVQQILAQLQQDGFKVKLSEASDAR